MKPPETRGQGAAGTALRCRRRIALPRRLQGRGLACALATACSVSSFLLPSAARAQASPARAASAAAADGLPTKTLGIVTITAGGQPTSLPTQIPATMESVTREQIERTINATDSEDALKYLPSLLVRKRVAGDGARQLPVRREVGGGRRRALQRAAVPDPQQR